MKLQYIIRKTTVFLLCFLQGISLSILISCSNQKSEKKSGTQDLVTKTVTTQETHQWYYLSGEGFKNIDLPKNAPSAVKIPWTEAVRISSTGTATDLNDGKTPLAYAIVNRVGILMFDGKDVRLFKDSSIFSGKTAQNLFFCNKIPLYTVFKSSIFNKTESSSDNRRPFLLQFRPDTGISYPVIDYENLDLPDTAEITDLNWNGNLLTCSIKNTIAEDKINFSYITIQPKENLLSISPDNAKTSLSVKSISSDDFRTTKKNYNYAEAPERLKKLLETIPSDIPLYIRCTVTGGSSPVIYKRESISEKSVISAYSAIAENWTAAVFSDGTVYVNGSFYGRHLLENGRNIAILLPKLPAGFSYGPFAVSGTTLYVSWEETDFYKTGKSGFLMVDLDKILYDLIK